MIFQQTEPIASHGSWTNGFDRCDLPICQDSPRRCTWESWWTSSSGQVVLKHARAFSWRRCQLGQIGPLLMEMQILWLDATFEYFWSHGNFNLHKPKHITCVFFWGTWRVYASIERCRRCKMHCHPPWNTHTRFFEITMRNCAKRCDRK